MKKVLLFLAVLALGVGLFPNDSFGQTAVPKSVTFLWTANGDDGTTGTAAQYDIRYSTDSVALAAWTTATQLTGEPAPKVSGSAETWTTTINLVEGTKYYFAIKALDEAGNVSPISPIVSKTWLDTTPPGAIIDFRVQ